MNHYDHRVVPVCVCVINHLTRAKTLYDQAQEAAGMPVNMSTNLDSDLRADRLRRRAMDEIENAWHALLTTPNPSTSLPAEEAARLQRSTATRATG